MSRVERTAQTTHQPVPPSPLQTSEKEEFLPRARPARYRGEVEIRETEDPLVMEDEQLDTEWFNPTDVDVVLPVYIGTDPKGQLWRRAFAAASPARRLEMSSGTRTFIVKAGQTRMIPSEFDLAIQRTHCLHPQCGAKKDACKNLDHPRVVIAGLAPQLLCKKWHKVPSLSANLDQARAQTDAAVRALSDASAQKIAAEMDTAQAKKLLEEAQSVAQAAIEARVNAERELERERAARLEAETKLHGKRS